MYFVRAETVRDFDERGDVIYVNPAHVAYLIELANNETLVVFGSEFLNKGDTNDVIDQIIIGEKVDDFAAKFKVLAESEKG